MKRSFPKKSQLVLVYAKLISAKAKLVVVQNLADVCVNTSKNAKMLTIRKLLNNESILK